MSAQAISWGEDAHRSVIQALSWPDNSRLACCSRAFYNAKITSATTNNSLAWWGQAQSISRDVEDLVASLVRDAKVLTPSARPNWSMLMIDSDVLLTTTTRDLCSRLQAASLIPMDCPILVVKSTTGVFGAGLGDFFDFSRYQGRDVELDPAAPVTAVLTVAYIPPEEGVNGEAARPRVQSFIVDDSPQNRRRRQSSRPTAGSVEPVLMECAPSALIGSALGCCSPAAAVSNTFEVTAAPVSGSGGSTSANAGCGGGGGGGGSGVGVGSGVGGGSGIFGSGGGSGTSVKGSAISESIGSIAGTIPEVHQSSLSGGEGCTQQTSMTPPGAANGTGIGSGGRCSTPQRLVGSAGAAAERVADGIAGGRGCNSSGGTQAQELQAHAQPQRRSTRLSTVVNSREARLGSASPRVRVKLSPPSASVPLEKADTILLVGQQPYILVNTTEWLESMLPKAVILGGVSGCALVIGDQVFPGDKLNRQPRRNSSPPLVVGVALRGVHAMAVSARGYKGLGPVFRMDTTVDRNREEQALPGQLLRGVTVFEDEGGIRRGEQTAMAVLCDQPLYQLLEEGDSDDSSNIFLGVATTAAELVNFRPSEGGGEAEEARGMLPMGVTMVGGGIVGLENDVTPGQYGRFLCTKPQLVLDDTETIYRSCKHRMEREGSTVLSSIHFTCCVRPDRVEQRRQRGADGEVTMEACVMSLHQQEMVRFCKTLNAPSAGIFCDGELGPAATLVGGILPKTASAKMQVYASCAAVLCWNPA